MKSSLTKLMNSKARTTSSIEKVKSYEFSEELNFPYVFEANSKGLLLSDWIEDNKELFDKKMLESGSVLFRNFEINTVAKFEALIDGFNKQTLEYKMRTSPRYSVGSNVYITTTYPQDRSINMHSESSYDRVSPANIAFCCITPAEEGGETPIADNRRVLQFMSDELRTKFKEKGVKYLRKINNKMGLPWQEVFQTTDKSIVEKMCMEKEMDFQWNGEDELIMTWTKDAIWKHDKSGKEIWFNHAYFFNKYAQDQDVLDSVESTDDLPYNSFFGDGEEISKEEILEIKEAYEKSTIEFEWESGDVIILDNMMISHARNPFKGDREIVVSIY